MVTKGLLGAVLALVGVAASAAITGSAHDFSSNAVYGTAGQVCIACHAPHNATNGALGQLWNHTPSATATYLVYASGTMSAAMPQPAGLSKLCLSCHDGTIAINSFGGTSGGSATTLAATASSLGTDLSNDHPIGIAYTTAMASADGGLFDPSSKTVAVGSSGTGYKLKAAAALDTSLLLGTGKVECASCHDVHNTFSMPAGSAAGQSGTTTTNKLLRVTMVGSTLCITCHDK
jgi:hypothetical protein